MISQLSTLKYKIVKVDPVSYSVNVPDDFIYNKASHKVSGESSVRLEVDSTAERIKCIVEFKLNCGNRGSEELKMQFFTLKSVSIFKLENLESYFINGKQDIDESILNIFFKISMNHARGMQSVVLKGTQLSRFLIPDVDFKPDPGSVNEDEVLSAR